MSDAARLLGALLVLVGVAVPHASSGFELDLTERELVKRLPFDFAEELRPGQTATTYSIEFCLDSSRREFAVAGSTSIFWDGGPNSNFQISAAEDGTVAIDARLEKQWLVTSLLMGLVAECKATGAPWLPITTINGKTSLETLFGDTSGAGSGDRFKADVEFADLQEMTGVYLLTALSDGESGGIYQPFLCLSSDNRLMISAMSPLEGTDRSSFIVTMANGEAAVSSSTADLQRGLRQRTAAALDLPCPDIYSSIALRPVGSIDGHTSLRDLLAEPP